MCEGFVEDHNGTITVRAFVMNLRHRRHFIWLIRIFELYLFHVCFSATM